MRAFYALLTAALSLVFYLNGEDVRSDIYLAAFFVMVYITAGKNKNDH